MRAYLLLLALFIATSTALSVPKDEWAAVALTNAPTLNGHSTVALPDNTLAVVGGYTGSVFSDAVYLHPTNTSAWYTGQDATATANPTPTARRYAPCVVSDSGESVFMFLGDDGVTSDEVWEATNISTSGDMNYTWVQHTPSGTGPSAREGHTVARVDSTLGGGAVAVFGGTDSTATTLADLYLYDFDTDAWLPISPSGTAPALRTRHTAVATSSACMVVFGGSDGATGTYADVFQYCSDTDAWLEHTPLLGSVPSARYAHAAVFVKARMLVYGGTTGLAVLSELYSYDPVTYTWELLSLGGSAPEARVYTSLTYTRGLVWLVAGRDSGSTVLSTTYAANVTINLCARGYYSAGAIEPCTPCPAGQYADSLGSRNCTDCPAGSYSDTAGSSACTLCVNGTWSDSIAATDVSTCVDCPAGSFGNVTGATSADECYDCKPGSYSESAGSDTCTLCDDGEELPTYGSDNSGDCASCGQGTYAPSPGTPNCLNCPGGYYQGLPGQSSCDDCIPGQYSTGAALFCSSCGFGTYGPYTNANSATMCFSCNPGTYGPINGLSVCTNCTAGTYNAGTGSTTVNDCSACPRGTASATEAATSSATCVDCTPGSYANTQGSTQCTLCGTGTYSTATRATSAGTCKACKAGTKQPNEGASSAAACVSCGAGTYAGAGSASCTPCPPGTYSTATGATAESDCVACPATTYSDTNGTTSCTDCATGQFSFSGATVCLQCDNTTFSAPALATNGDFEIVGTSNPAQGWRPRGSGYSLGAGRSGSGATATAATAAESWGAELNVSVAYVNRIPVLLKGWGYVAGSLSGSVDDSYAYTLTVTYADGSTGGLTLQLPHTLTTWESVSGVFYPNKKTVVALTVAAVFDSHSGSVIFDDVSLTPLPEASCACPAGYYYDHNIVNTGVPCTYCPAGSACIAGLRQLCSGDSFSFGGASDCRECHDGWVCDAGIGSPCLAGTFLNESVGECQDCPPGYQCVNGNIEPCVPGTYHEGSPNKITCDPCTVGFYAANNASSSCDQCINGTTSNYARDGCFSCTAGEYSVGGAPCSACPEGYRSTAAVGSTGCVECGLGEFSGTGSSSACFDCPANTFGNVTGLAECYDCPDGTTSGVGASVCV